MDMVPDLEGPITPYLECRDLPPRSLHVSMVLTYHYLVNFSMRLGKLSMTL
jgi:hypothetical protein